MNDNDVIKLTPKGIVALNLTTCGFAEDLEDARIQLFWHSLNEDLRMFGYEIIEI